MILFLGSLEVSHDVFWKDNDVFAIVGYSEATLNEYYIYLFDIKIALSNDMQSLTMAIRLLLTTLPILSKKQ